MPYGACIEFENINTENKNIDIYGLGYEIIHYEYVDNKLICKYTYNK